MFVFVFSIGGETVMRLYLCILFGWLINFDMIDSRHYAGERFRRAPVRHGCPITAGATLHARQALLRDAFGAPTPANHQLSDDV
ncbi:hypothetical protein G5S35_16105 [Paraburkholderia tropica]|uniref:hypothetical protein n=1 Tax=Paraburkholderia tropica TaxID=92647 RepID=UPI0016030988|nr:hypothetical protein [Paraburkholderia tropica]QNB13185.1 hypothetical protein G5S35_16105 [Paraburkholderia tropica]